MPRLSDPRLPIEGLAALRGYPAPGGRHIVRILARTRPLSRAHDGALRLRMSIKGMAGNPSPATAIAVGIGEPGAPSFLIAEAALPPGRYRVRPEGKTGPEIQIGLPEAAGEPVSSYCPHKGASPSHSGRHALFSERGEALAGIILRHLEKCCRNNMLKPPVQWTNHDFLVIFRPAGNPLHLAIGKTTHIVRPGQYIISPPGQADRFAPGIPFPVHVRQYFVFPGALAGFRTELGMEKAVPLFGGDTSPRTLDPRFARALDAWEESMGRVDTPVRMLDARSLMHHVLCFLLQAHPGQAVPHAPPFQEGASLDPRLKLAMDHLAAHLAEPYDRIALARAARASDQHLRWLFQTRLGMPPVEYLQALRVEQAKKLLADPEKKLQTVAWEVGYRDVRTFRRVFRKFTEKEIQAFRG